MKEEISVLGKVIAGILLIVMTSLAINILFAYWPGMTPSVKDGDEACWYANKPYRITLLAKTDCNNILYKDSINKQKKEIKAVIDALKDSISKNTDSLRIVEFKKLLDTKNDAYTQLDKVLECQDCLNPENKIHLNTLLLILVATMGFLGNMIHMATSFTTFVGNGTFVKRWVLWYFVKPFTAAALAILSYLVIRAGFMGYGSGASSVSLYGILALAALTGLFTDIATLKLKEVFTALFKPDDKRYDKPESSPVFLSTIPAEIPRGEESSIVITGKNLTQATSVKIDGILIENIKITPDNITILYTPSEAAIAAGKMELMVFDKGGKTLYTVKILIR